MENQRYEAVEGGVPNRLIHEKSPYLIQHAWNPVDWFPWGAAAFEKAEKQNKPIFLSIGYSTCHWCHVMERESFEDPGVAELMNRAFVSVKVDREERPDLDHVYMAVCQMLTGRGGWPLTMIMTPDKRPFFAATYLPKGNRFGQTGMMSLIPKIEEIWKSRHGDVIRSAEEVMKALEGMESIQPMGDLNRPILERAYGELSTRFDEGHGGFGEAPKFPTPHNLIFLLRHWKRSNDSRALQMVEKTLQAMRYGGVYDQVGFGFHRYSTDREWLVPHFEKMLYDQALTAMAYLETYQATGKGIYRDTAAEIFTYVLRDMTNPEGGFYSAEDADSEGEEGKFYVWREEEIRVILDRNQADLIIRLFHVEKNGNFRDEASGKSTGTNILHPGKSIPALAADLGLSAPELEDRIASARKRLLEAREKRIHPHKDDKILTDWNGLMIASLAKGAQVLGEGSYALAARKGAEFVLGNLRNADGRLLHRHRDGEAGIAAHLDDYAFLVWGLIELYEATFEIPFLKAALDLNEDMMTHFWDHEKGGLFFTADDAEVLIVRTKETHDGAVPSGNGVAMLNLLRLSRFTGRADLEERAAQIGRAFSGQIEQMPSAYTQFLMAADFGFGPSYEVVIAGTSTDEDTRKMLDALRSRFIPNRVILLRPDGHRASEIAALAPFTRDQAPLDGKATAYVCLDQTCGLPTTDVEEMLKMIR